MKINRLLFISMVFLFMLMFFVAIFNPVSAQSQVVDIPDENLEQTIRIFLDKPTGDITVADMETLTRLYSIYGLEIEILTGLEYATNLEYLYLGNNISDLSPLSGLTKLEELFLNYNNISDISPLSGLTNLSWLDLSGNSISDISPLSGLTNLEILSLWDNEISDLSSLSSLTNLHQLSLWDNEISDLSPLSNLTNLRVLELNYNNVSDLSPLSELTNLQMLSLGSNNISDLSPLSGLTSLWVLTLWNNEISDLSSLPALPNLQMLSLKDNEISDLSPLSGLTSLDWLELNSNNISDLSPLSGLTNLYQLNLSDNNIIDLSPLSGLTSLGWLDLRFNYIDITTGSEAMGIINDLIDSGTYVLYEPQKELPLENVERLSGANRYQTAIEISKSGWESAATVVLARGDDYADALAGVPLAYLLNAPILLTPTANLHSATEAEIVRLGADEVILLGGTAAISNAVKDELEGKGFNVERIAGTNRYHTAALIAERLDEAGATFDTAFIAVGTNFADALAASSYAAMRGEPILLTSIDTLPAATSDALSNLGIVNTYVCGGTAAVSSSVFDQLPNPTRISGANRYATALALAEEFLPDGANHVGIATGLNFPDAIAGGVWAAKLSTGILLVDGRASEPSSAVQKFLNDNDITAVTLFGGSGVISSEMADWFLDNLGN